MKQCWKDEKGRLKVKKVDVESADQGKGYRLVLKYDYGIDMHLTDMYAVQKDRLEELAKDITEFLNTKSKTQ